MILTDLPNAIKKWQEKISFHEQFKIMKNVVVPTLLQLSTILFSLLQSELGS